MRIVIVVIAATMALPTIRADLITYTFNDEGVSYGFSGSMTIDTTRLGTNALPGRVITLDSVVASNFEYRRYDRVLLPIRGVAVNIDPVTGAVLTNSGISLGPSPLIQTRPGSTYQVLSAFAELSTRYNLVGYRNFDILGAQYVAGEMETWSPTEHRYWTQFMSFGHWDVQITPVPAPPAWLLAGLGAVGFWRMRSRKTA